jgi:hypothetical protein
MLKPFKELRELDVKEFCKFRERKDEDGKKVQIPYRPWAKCLGLLYDNGAERVRFRALPAPDGSYLFCGEEAVSQKKIYGKNGEVSYEERRNSCYFVTVEVEIDGDVNVMPYPVMNGTAVVYNETLNQLRVSNSIQRAFVKCVAVNTGLGISLWEDDKETEDHGKQPDVITAATPMVCKDHIDQMVTDKIKKGLAFPDLLSMLSINEKQYKIIIQGLQNASWLIGALQKL